MHHADGDSEDEMIILCSLLLQPYCSRSNVAYAVDITDVVYFI